MACSDNVVRAGLTPKLKDVETLTDILTYKCESWFAKKFCGYCEDNYTEIFQPPVPDFAVAKILVSFFAKQLNIASYYCKNTSHHNKFIFRYHLIK